MPFLKPIINTERMNMRYTIAALADNEEIIEIMWNSFIAIGSPSESIIITYGIYGVSQP